MAARRRRGLRQLDAAREIGVCRETVARISYQRFFRRYLSLAGMTGMAFPRFLLAWCLSAIPYVLIAAYAGSVSTLANPRPAIFTALGLSAVLWTAWLGFRRYRRLPTE